MTAQPPEETPRVELDFTVAWCARHLDPFRAEWPKGAPVAMVALLRICAAKPAVVQWAQGDAHRLNEALQRFSPLCCFLRSWELDGIYEKAGVSRAGT